MKQRILAALILAGVLLGMALPTATSAATVVTFADPNLANQVRLTLNNPDALISRQPHNIPPGGDIMVEDLLDLHWFAYGGDAGLTDITGLEYATNLTWLALNANNISDISPLAGLTKLIQLNLDNNNISNLTPLANMTNLVYLVLNGNNISDISSLAGLTSLTQLYLDYNSVSDLSLLANLETLQTLRVQYNGITSVGPLGSMPGLMYLNLGHNSISDLSGLAGLSSVTNLQLYYNNISDLTPLANLTTLGNLQLTSNNISDLTPLANLTNLTNLQFNSNSVSDLTPLQNLPLRILRLDYNSVRDISPLVANQTLPFLARIWIRYNYLDTRTGSNDMADILALRDRRVYVYYDPQYELPSDDIPPTTSLVLTGVSGIIPWYVSEVQVTLSAVDEGDSGVSKTEFSLDGGNWITYTEPFFIAKQGMTSFAYRSIDNAGNIEDERVVDVWIDTIAPVLEPVSDTTSIWPPNHKMVPVFIAVNASDNSRDPIELQATVSSSEPDEALGDGNTTQDMTTPLIQYDNTIWVELRAESAGYGSGRIYTVTIIATDAAGNSATSNVDILVPHDQGARGKGN